jgi:hypothetical protein
MISNVSSSQPSRLIAHNQKMHKSEVKQSKDIIDDNGNEMDDAQKPKNIDDNGENLAGDQNPLNIDDTQTTANNALKNGTPRTTIDVKA